jgi:hypothetical protein
MHLTNIILSLLGLNVVLARAVTVSWPRGYNPTQQEQDKAVARAEELADRNSSPLQTSSDQQLSPLSTLSKRASSSGCVQAHCGAAKNTVPDYKTYYEFTIWHNGQLTHYLMGASSQFKPSGQMEWAGVRDPSGNQWGFRMSGDCGRLEYLNTIQSSYGWVALDTIDSKKTSTEGWCYGESRSGQAKCVKATLWEVTYSDNGQCSGKYGNPATCDYRGRCVDVNHLPSYGPASG